MKRRILLLAVLLSVTVMIFTTVAVPAASAQKVEFEPVRAPSKGPDDAPVTVYEIGDFM